MKRLALALLLTVVAVPALGQSLTCGTLKATASQSASHYRWTVSGPSGNTTETGSLRGAPHFECVNGAVLVVEVTSTAGYSTFAAYFPDGTDIDYGGAQIVHRNNRYVLPIQARARIAAQFRAAFDYHCRMEMPADPITPAMRADCAF
ncbi:MAG TPA: hypothetical protein VMI56_25700 [Reyranella sp.]|nr:hypothetical protein [Reyranella sp.]